MTDTPSVTRCAARKGGYSETQCELMQRACKPYSKSRTGLLSRNIVNINTGERLGTQIVNVAERGDDPVVFNLCPFCCGELRDLDVEETEFITEHYANLLVHKRMESL